MKLTISIDGTDQELDLNEILSIREPESERATCAVYLAYWGGIFGAKLEEEELADANYRAWHGETVVRLLGTSGDKGPAEWKVKAIIEADGGFLTAKAAIAKTKRDVASAKAVFDAYSRKADILARLIARENTEHIRSGGVGVGSYDSHATPTKATAKTKDDKAAKVAAAIAQTKLKTKLT